jgi:hypothetical protein
MGGAIDLDGRSDHDVVADTDFIAVQDVAQDIQKDVIAEVNVLAVDTVKGRLDEGILADMPQQLPEDGLSFGLSFGQIVAPEYFLDLLALSFQASIETVVEFSG